MNFFAGAPRSTAIGAWRAKVDRWLRARSCLLCGEVGAGARDLCIDCARSLPRLQGPCPCIGLDEAWVAFDYRFPLDRLLPRFKFHEDLAAGVLLSELLADGMAQAPRPDALVPVPLHPRRLRERGYDQALELAKAVARRLDVPLRADRLRRRRATAAQTELGAMARQVNVEDAFACGPGRALPRHVALVDDVMTTGATLRACARALRAAGVVRIQAWVVARAAPPGD